MELVDKHDLGSCVERRASSSLAVGTKIKIMDRIPIDLSQNIVIPTDELFTIDTIDSLMVYMSKWGDKWKTTGHIRFKKRQTNAQQEFIGETLEDVIAQIKAFLVELAKNQKDGPLSNK